MANKGVVAPRLPAAPPAYDEAYINSLLNILRQYFNQLDNSGPVTTSTQKKSATEVISAISCAKPSTTGSNVAISLPTQADFAYLKSGDIYHDTSGGVATSYPLRIKA